MTPSNRSRKWTADRRPSWIVGGAVFVVVVSVWQLGWLQSFDLALYDQFLCQRPKSASNESPLTLVIMTEEDVRHLGYPPSDARLAELLTLLGAAQPRVIGLDIYRDLPEPRSGEESSTLAETLHQLPNVIAIVRLPDQERPGIGPPPALLHDPERIGFNNFPVDTLDGILRRGLLFAGFQDGTNSTTMASFALLVAQRYLAAEGLWPEPGHKNIDHLRLGLQEFVPLRSSDGAYVRADAAGYQCLLDFLAPSEFPTFRVSEVLAGRIPPEAVRDRAVLIGAVTESVRDEQPSPFGTRVHGVEWQAQFVDQIIRRARTQQPPMRFVSEGWEGMLTLLCCYAGAGWIGRGRSVWVSLLELFGGVGLLLGLNQWGLRLNWWIPVAPAGFALIASAGFSAVWNWHSQRRERQLVMRMFSTHVSPEIAELLWTQRHAFMEGRRPRPLVLRATVLFTDLRNFSAMAARVDPAQLLDWLNEYTEAMSERILARAGVIHEYVGDAILATFGVPVPRKTEEEIAADARAAVEAALDMAEALTELNAAWVRRGMPVTEMRVGVDTGPVVGGSLGSQARLKYAVVGDTVVTASRLESLDHGVAAIDSPIPHCRILVSDATKHHLEGRFNCRCLGPFILKGRQTPVTIHQVFARVNSKEKS